MGPPAWRARGGRLEDASRGLVRHEA